MKKALCFASGLLMAAALLLCAVLLPAGSTQRFEAALQSTVNQQALGVAQGDLSAFAEETMRYLRGEKAGWNPLIPREGVSQAFRFHMAEVRLWAQAAPWVIAVGLALGAALLWLGGFQRRQALSGVLALIALLAVILLWAAVDFDSFWMLLHRAFIPGGIFSAHEPVMQLFPLALFMQYILPVCLWALGLLGALCAVLGLKTKDAGR